MPSSQKPANSSSNSMRAVDDLALRPLLGIVEVAQILGLPRATLYRWHSLSTPETPIGPRAFRVGRHLRYTLGDVSNYIEVTTQRHPTWEPGIENQGEPAYVSGREVPVNLNGPLVGPVSSIRPVRRLQINLTQNGAEPTA